MFGRVLSIDGDGVDYATLKAADNDTLRAMIRDGRYTSHTAGLATGFLQSNIVILPEHHALDFMRFCQRNPKPCPLSAVSDTGNPKMHTLGQDIDIRYDVPAYNIYKDGRLTESVTSIENYWDERMVAFALGCSFTFEHALMQAGVKLWHVENNTTVPMFRTSLDTVPAGPFSGKMVVSMRTVPTSQVQLVSEVSARYPLAHGAPVHTGPPAHIGIDDIANPQWGDAVPVPDDHVTMFWACGVTPQLALEQAGLPLCVTHKPGHMLITDVPQDAEIPIFSKANCH